MTPDGYALLVSGNRLLVHTHFTVLVSNPIQEVGRVALPLGVAWVDCCQTAPEGEAFLINRQRPRALIQVVAVDSKRTVSSGDTHRLPPRVSNSDYRKKLPA